MAVSVRDIVERVQRAGNDVALLPDRIRHWTREGLLQPEGDPRPGTGKTRLYGSAALREAAILNRMAEMGLGVKPMHQAMAAWRGRVPKVDAALLKADDCTVLLQIGSDRRASSFGLVVLTEDNRADELEGLGMMLSGINAAIIINLSLTLAGL